MTYAAPKLKKLYLRLNRKWFSGKLPRDIRIGWNKNLKWQGIMGWAWNDAEGGYFIEISPEYRNSWRLLEWTVLHEMVHIKMFVRKLDDVGHGEKFQKEMLRLAKAGALKHLW